MKINFELDRLAGQVGRDVEAVQRCMLNVRPSSILLRPEPFDELRTPLVEGRASRASARITPRRTVPTVSMPSKTRSTRSPGAGRPEVERIGVQRCRVAPVDLVHPTKGSLIPVQVWIGDDAGRHQVGVYAAGHFGRIGPRHAS